VTETALANYVVNSDPDGIDHGLEARRLSENRPIYYGRTCQAGFSDPFR
jgi:hypothetical protein